MAIDPTLQETLLKRSVRKYFTDNLETAKSIPIFFDAVYTIPKVGGVELNSWIVFHFGDIKIDTLSSCMLQIYCFSRKDVTGEALSVLRDSFMDVIFDEEATDKVKKIPYLNASFVKIGGIVPIVVDDGGSDFGDDGTKFKVIMVKLHWGAK